MSPTTRSSSSGAKTLREAFSGGAPGGVVHTYESGFHDIVPDQRIVYTYEMYADEEEGTRSFLESLAASVSADAS